MGRSKGILMNIFLLCGVLCLIGVDRARALDNGVGLRPPMGWNTWMSFVDVAMNETEVMQNALQLVQLGLADLGYKYVNVDCGWSAPNRTAEGKIVGDPIRFPHGMAALGKYIHGLGLQYGLYTARGVQECCNRVGYNGTQYAQTDAQTFAEWEIDFLKIDSCFDNPDATESQWDQFAAMRDALNATGRPVFLSICPTWANYTGNNKCKQLNVVYSSYAFDGQNPSDLANSFLVEYTNSGNMWSNLICHIDAANELTNSSWSGPGHWNDDDLMTVGCSDHTAPVWWTPCKGWQSQSEYRAQMSLLSIWAAPLILGNDLRYISSETLEIIANTEVIEINQDELGYRGVLVASSTDGLVQVYSKPLVSGALGVCIVNGDNETRSINVTWSGVLSAHNILNANQRGRGIWKDHPIQKIQDGTTAAAVRDLWAHEIIGQEVVGGMVAQVMGHDAALWRVMFTPPAVPVAEGSTERD